MSELVRGARESFLAFDGRILRTVGTLVARPGGLTVRFLACSFLFFLGLSLCDRPLIRLSNTGGSGLTIDTSVAEESAEFAAELEKSDGPIARFFRKAQEDPEGLDRAFADWLARAVVLLIPVFALLLRILHRRRKYVVQLVFSLHLHCFAMLALIVGLIVDTALDSSDTQRPGNGVAVLAILIYTFLALRRVQGQGRRRTLAKMVALGFGYLIALVATMGLAVTATALTL